MATELEKVVHWALKLGQKHLADYGATRSRHDFTQAQLMSCLVLKAYLKTTYRSVLDIICASHQFIKLSVIVWCTSLLPLAMSVDVGPSNDRKQAPKLLAQAQGVGRPSKLLADAGYDSNWMHEYCRQQWGVESIIKPFIHRKDGTRGGKYRAKMSPEHLKRRGYGKRWAVESFLSAMKRKVGSSLTSRKKLHPAG